MAQFTLNFMSAISGMLEQLLHVNILSKVVSVCYSSIGTILRCCDQKRLVAYDERDVAEHANMAYDY